MAVREKSFGERLIGIANVVNLSTWFLFGPVIVLLILLFSWPVKDYFGHLFYYIGAVYVAGGFFFLSTKLWEIWDFHFILYKRAQWKASPMMKKTFFKICLPADFDHTADDYVGFFYDLLRFATSGRTKYEIYAEGKWYYDCCFDFLYKGEELEIYFYIPFKRSEFIQKVFKTHFPEIKLVECEDPYKKWPKNWEDDTKIDIFDEFNVTNYKLAASPWWPVGDPSGLGNNTPITRMTKAIKDFASENSDVMVVMNFTMRPMDNGKMAEWRANLDKEKSEILSKTASFKVAGRSDLATTGDLVTESQKKLFSQADQKFNEAHTKFNIRVFTFYPKHKKHYGVRIEKLLRPGFGATFGDANGITKDWFTASDRFFFSSPFPFLDGFIGPIMNRLYHYKEVEYRKKVQYRGMRSRNVDITHSGAKLYVSMLDLARILSFPHGCGPTFPEEQNRVQKSPQQIIDAEQTNVVNKNSEIQKESTTVPAIEKEINKDTPVTSFNKLQALRSKAQDQATHSHINYPQLNQNFGIQAAPNPQPPQRQPQTSNRKPPANLPS